jgi:hypothetical protein
MRASHIGSALLLGTASLLAASRAKADDLVIKEPNAHPDYKVELEPHGDIILFRYAGAGNDLYRGRGLEPEFGAGFRATIELGHGFIPKLNNTFGISFGIDATNCRFCQNNVDFRVFTPVTLQWNFWLTHKWSAFADLGFMLRNDGFFKHVYPDFVGMIGGRYLFNDKVALTMRIGYPFVSVGVSFFAG